MKLLLLLLNAGKLGKLLLSGGSMLISVAVYAWVFGWAYAVGFVALILVHEMGHLLAARQCGLAVSAPMFIPFVGAWVALKDDNLDAHTEAYVGLGGPVLGTVAAFVCYLLAQETGKPLWMALAYAGFFINLFNLVPLRPLDGGRIVRAVSTRLWWVGLPLLVALFIWRPSPLLAMVGLLALPDIWAAWRGQADTSAQAVPLKVRWQFGSIYLALVAGLAVMALDAHQRLPPV